MFRKLVQMLGRSAPGAADLEGTARSYLGDAYAAEVRRLQDGQLQDEPSVKRAQGVLALTRAIGASRGVLNDPERHRHFWTDVARPSINARYALTFGQGYDPARFYVDALDYAAVTGVLPAMLSGGEQPVAARLIDTVQALNLREQATGGYFGNTPYWPLHAHPLWRAVNREFPSVQAYWLALLTADEAGAALLSDLSQALLGAGLDEVAAWTPAERDQVFAVDLPQLTHMVALGALSVAASQHPGASRAQALATFMNTYAPNAPYFFTTLLQAGLGGLLAELKTLFPEGHPVRTLPDHHFTLGLQVQAALMKVLANVDLTGTLINMRPDENVLNDARNQAPHLLHASL